MVDPHQGNVELVHTFEDSHSWLIQSGPVDLVTSQGTAFAARASVARGGAHPGEKTIIFIQHSKEYGRAYPCCWGHYYNCNRTRIGMYCAALDTAVG